VTVETAVTVEIFETVVTAETVETVVIVETFETAETGETVETVIISKIIYYECVMDNILSLMASITMPIQTSLPKAHWAVFTVAYFLDLSDIHECS